jgi:hypothetical protein
MPWPTKAPIDKTLDTAPHEPHQVDVEHDIPVCLVFDHDAYHQPPKSRPNPSNNLSQKPRPAHQVDVEHDIPVCLVFDHDAYQ